MCLRTPCEAVVSSSTLLTDEPRAPAEFGWSRDKRRLGIHLRTLALEDVDRPVRLGEKVEFGAGSGGQRLLGDGWSELEPTGVWTVEDRAHVSFQLSEGTPADVDLLLEVVRSLAARHRKLEVEVFAGGQRVGGQVFRQGGIQDTLQVHVPGALTSETDARFSSFTCVSPLALSTWGLEAIRGAWVYTCARSR